MDMQKSLVGPGNQVAKLNSLMRMQVASLMSQHFSVPSKSNQIGKIGKKLGFSNPLPYFCLDHWFYSFY